MKFKWQLMSVLLGLSLILVFSCQDDKDEPLDNKGSISFNISSLTVPTDDNPAGRVGVDPVEEGMCDMQFASYVVVQVDGIAERLDIEQWGGDFKTDLLELDPGMHSLESFVVFTEDGLPIFATPTKGSEFGKFVATPLVKEFEVAAYEKIENYIEVLCIEEFTPPQFGFKFWDFDIIQVEYLCIFANYCEDDFGHMVADLHIEIYPNAQQTTQEDLIWSGSGGPSELLCAPFPYDSRIAAEEQVYYVVLMINGIQYVADIDLGTVMEINSSEQGYLHLNKDCKGDIRPFSRVAQIAYEDLIDNRNDQDYNDMVAGVEISGNGEQLIVNVLPMARGAGYEHRFELVFPANAITAVNAPFYIREEGDMKVVVVSDETSQLFGASYVNVNCNASASYAPLSVVIDITEDFVFKFDKPLKACLHTIANSSTTYNLFLYDWDPDIKSTYFMGDAEFPNGLVINKDWTRGVIWQWPIEGQNILDAYSEFSPLPLTPGWYDGPVDPMYIYPDGLICDN
jgi:hypothetical protein